MSSSERTSSNSPTPSGPSLPSLLNLCLRDPSRVLATLREIEAERIPTRYRFHPEQYLPEVLGVQLFEGFTLPIVRRVAASWLHLHARERHARGLEWEQWQTDTRPDLPHWRPGQAIVNTFILQGGHKQGKSVLAAALLLWAVHVSERFSGVVYAPVTGQALTTTWRYVDMFLDGELGGKPHCLAGLRSSRRGGTLKPGLDLGHGRGVTTKATKEGVTVQGEHASGGEEDFPTSLHLCEEADGIDRPAVFDAISSIVAGGISLWLVCLNPESPLSPAQS